MDRAGRVTVESDLTLPGHPEVFAVGDMVRVRGADGSDHHLPGVAPVAMQQGRYAARACPSALASEGTRPFRYRDKGNLATIGRGAAVVEIKRVRLSGFLALDHLAGRPLFVPGRLPEPATRDHPVGVQLHHPWPRRPVDHHDHSERSTVTPRRSSRRMHGTIRPGPADRPAEEQTRIRALSMRCNRGAAASGRVEAL